MLLERNNFSESILHSCGSQTFTYCSPSPQQERLTLARSASCSVILGEGWCSQFIWPCPMCHLYIYVIYIHTYIHEWHAPTACMNRHSGRLDFCTLSFICGYLPKAALQIFLSQPGRACSQLLLICIPYQGLSAYYQIHRWAKVLLYPLVYGAGSHNSYTSTFVCGWMSN